MSSSPPRCLKTETTAVTATAAQCRISAARFPARKTLEEFDFTFQTIAAARRPCCTSGSSTSCRQREHRAARTARDRQNASLDRARDPRVPRRAPRAVQNRDRMGRAPRRRATPRPPRRRARATAARPAVDRRRGRLHPVRPPSREPHVHARLPPLRTRQPDRHQQQAVQRAGARSSATKSPPPR